MTKKRLKKYVKTGEPYNKVGRTKLKEWIIDENKGAKEYHKYGLHTMARDEERHSRLLKKLTRG